MIRAGNGVSFPPMKTYQERILAWFIFVILVIANVLSYYLKSEPKSEVLGTDTDHKPIVVGLVDSLTGMEATFGVETAHGLQIAFDEANKNGGINGRMIHLISVDDQGKPEESATAARRLISTNQAIALFGASSSQRSLVIAPMAQTSGVPLIVPGATHPGITRVGDHVFRVCFIDDFQGAFMAKVAIERFHAKRIALLTDMKSDYSVGLTDWFVKSAKSLGAEIVARQSYTAGDLDFRSQLTSIRHHKPDVIYAPGYYTDIGLIIRQARDLGMKMPFLGGDGWDSPRLIEIAGKSIGGVYFSNHFVSSHGGASPILESFVSQYERRYKRPPGSAAALAYDSGLVVIDAMKRADPLTRETLTEALKTVKNIEGVTGKISIGPDRNAIKDAVVVSVKNGQFIRAW